MRVLIVHYNPGAGGGAESAIRDQVAALRTQGCVVEVVYEHPRRAVMTFHPDVVHLHTVHVTLGMGVLEWVQAQGTPHVLSLHDYWPFCDDRMLMRDGAEPPSERDAPCSAVEGVCDGQCVREAADPRVLQVVNRSPTITFSRGAATIMQRNGVRLYAVVPHGIDTDLFRPADGGQVVEARLVTTSAWPRYATKGMHVLREALRRTRLRATLISGVPRERVAQELRKGAIFVFPSTYQETWGLCLTEGMATGLACIASAVAGPRDQIVDGETGLLVPPRDPQALADALRVLVAQPDVRQEMGRKARLWAEGNASLDALGRRYLRLYGELLELTRIGDSRRSGTWRTF